MAQKLSNRCHIPNIENRLKWPDFKLIYVYITFYRLLSKHIVLRYFYLHLSQKLPSLLKKSIAELYEEEKHGKTPPYPLVVQRDYSKQVVRYETTSQATLITLLAC